jgi:hypothetical protein
MVSEKRLVQGGKKINVYQTSKIRMFIKDKLPNQLKLSHGLCKQKSSAAFDSK